MEAAANNQSRLIEDIKSDARAEAEKLKAEAERQVRERAAEGERQVEAIRADARKAGAAQAEALKKTLTAAFAAELKKITLKARDQVYRRILEQVEDKLARRVTEPGYRDVLLALIVEAAIGLGAAEAEVNASPAERELVDEKLLRAAEAKVKALVLRPVRLRKSEAAPLLLQGVVLSAADGRTAYNNQVRTRLLRNQGQIRKLIFDRLQLS